MLYLHHESESHSHATRRALLAADGYLYLNLAKMALGELDGIPEEEKDDAGVLLARNRVLLHLGKWQDAETLAARGAEVHPQHEEFTVQRAFALHKMKCGDRAMDVLLSAPEWIRRTGILHYNLACYEAQLGDLKTAKQCISVAIQMNEAMRKNAKVDPDLQALQN